MKHSDDNCGETRTIQRFGRKLVYRACYCGLADAEGDSFLSPAQANQQLEDEEAESLV